MKFEELVLEERKKQDLEWGGETHDDEHHPQEWYLFLHKQMKKLEKSFLIKTNNSKNIVDEKEYKQTLIKIAALSQAAFETFERNNKKVVEI